MNFPTTITTGNVLDGIADAVAIIRSPLADNPEADVTITFDTGPFNPPVVHYDPVTQRLREFRNGDLEYLFTVRPRIVFNIPFLTATEAAKWRRVWNEIMNGYRVFLRPHNDSGLTLEWDVVPTPGTSHVLLYVANRYVGHAVELSFTARQTQRVMNLQSSQPEFSPIIR